MKGRRSSILLYFDNFHRVADLPDEQLGILFRALMECGEKEAGGEDGITVTGARTRFGSCSPKNRLCFSFRLMEYPLPAIEYVVVHELAHIRHKNHGPDFYRLVEGTLPDYRQRIGLLKLPPSGS